MPGVTGSGHAYAGFLFGVPTSSARPFPPITVQRRRWNYDFFVQDDWKIKPHLTLNLGLRYDVHPGWYEKHDQRDIDAPQPDERLYVNNPRPFPQCPAISYLDNGASYDYRGFTLEAERRMKNGLFVQLAYTAARDEGDTNEWWEPIENPFDLGRERGRDRSAPAHRFISAVIYELPFGRDRKWMNDAPRWIDLAVGSWQLSVVGYQQTGVYLTPTITVPDPTGTRFTTGANRPNVSIRPDQLGDAALADPTIAQWFDPTAFGVPPIGRFGTAARGSIVGPGVWHAGIHKTFRVSDRAGSPTFRVELTSTNVFNHPNWANPNTNVTPTNVNAARISATGGPTGGQQAGARSMRLGIRAEW